MNDKFYYKTLQDLSSVPSGLFYFNYEDKSNYVNKILNQYIYRPTSAIKRTFDTTIGIINDKFMIK